MSLESTGLTTQGVSITQNTSINNLVPITIATWVYIDTTGNSIWPRIFCKRVDVSNYWEMQYSGTPTINFSFSRVYSPTSAWSSCNGFLTTGIWQFIAATFDGTNASKLYVGSLTSIVSEVSSYANYQAPSGTNCNDATANLYLMQRPSVTAMDGKMAWAGIWNRSLTLGELQAQQYHPHVTADCKLFMHLGFNGTGTQVDWSGNGNNGTPANLTVANHVPLGPLVLSAPRVPVQYPRPIRMNIGNNTGAVVTKV